MTDYWKSTGKWFCDICKCWTADNRPSINFHEKGKNHQANLQRRIGEIKKGSIAKRKKDAKDEKMFEKMEKDALAAVQKDISHGNTGVGKSDMKNMVSAHSSQSSSAASDTYPWTMMTAPQGFTYYYNKLTGESTWQMPAVFKKIEEEKRKEENAAVVSKSKKEKTKKKMNDDADCIQEEQPVEEHDIHPLLGGWSTFKCDRVKKTKEPEPAKVSCDPSPVEFDEKEKSVETQVQRESGKKFKEKVMKTNLVSSDQPVAFKKRKSALKNVRKRNDDD